MMALKHLLEGKFGKNIHKKMITMVQNKLKLQNIYYF